MILHVTLHSFVMVIPDGRNSNSVNNTIARIILLPSSLAPMSMSTLGHAEGAIRVVRLIDTLLSMRQKHYQRRHHQQQNHQLNGKE